MPADVLVLFDLDHTLLPQDSDEKWVEFLIEEGAVDRRKYDAANRMLVTRYSKGEASALEFTEFYLSTLTEFDETKLVLLRDRYLEVKVKPRVYPKARALVEKHHAAGDLVVITTGVSRFLAAPIAALFGVENLIATEPAQVDGRYSGRVSGVPNMREGKVENLHVFLAGRGQRLRDFREVYAYSDSLNDVPLLSRATHPFVVNADALLAAYARHMGWPIIDFA